MHGIREGEGRAGRTKGMYQNLFFFGVGGQNENGMDLKVK